MEWTSEIEIETEKEMIGIMKDIGIRIMIIVGIIRNIGVCIIEKGMNLEIWVIEVERDIEIMEEEI
jgi:hypothetical protein